MTKTPSAKRLFALYHLGVDDEGVYRFRNLLQCAQYLNVSTDDLRRWLQAAQIDQDVVTSTEFNLSAAHVDAQLAATPTERLQIAARTFDAFVKARSDRSAGSKSVHLDIDYDAL